MPPAVAEAQGQSRNAVPVHDAISDKAHRAPTTSALRSHSGEPGVASGTQRLHALKPARWALLRSGKNAPAQAGRRRRQLGRQ